MSEFPLSRGLAVAGGALALLVIGAVTANQIPSVAPPPSATAPAPEQGTPPVAIATVVNEISEAPGEKIDLPHGFPAIVTVCSHGTRLWMGYEKAYEGNALSLVSRADDPTCP